MIDQAQPGDPDLDIDIKGWLLSTVVRTGSEFFMSGAGGSGWWTNDSGGRDDVATVEGLELMFELGVTRRHLAEQYEKVFRRWCDQRIPLRVLGAPNKDTCIGDGKTSLFIPRDPS